MDCKGGDENGLYLRSLVLKQTEWVVSMNDSCSLTKRYAVT